MISYSKRSIDLLFFVFFLFLKGFWFLDGPSFFFSGLFDGEREFFPSRIPSKKKEPSSSSSSSSVNVRRLDLPSKRVWSEECEKERKRERE